MKYDAILFDLDGTLIDSAPDLIRTLDDILLEYGRGPCDFNRLRNYVSHGSRKMLEVAFNGDLPIDLQTLWQQFLDKYQRQNTVETTFFPGIEALLDTIEASRTPWGIITNKFTQPTKPIARHFHLDQRAAAIVCGDTLSVSKPSPEPLQLACETIGVPPENCVYIGDCDTDIAAGKAAGMATIACEYGYLHVDSPIADWDADAIVAEPSGILALLR